MNLTKTRRPKYGSAVHNAKLNEEKVIEIRSLHAGGMSNKDLAIKYNVGKSLINRIVNRRMWKHI